MLRMPAEEERGGRYITMAREGGLWMDSIGEKQRDWVGCGTKATTAREQRNCLARQEKGREGEAVGFKQLDWIPNLAQQRSFESDPKLDRWMGQLP